jgi:hypothetical protein
MTVSRRNFLTGAVAALFAPAVPAMPLPEAWPGVMASPNLLTLNMITREAIRLFVNSNAFLQALEQDKLWDKPHIVGSELRIRMPSDGQWS